MCVWIKETRRTSRRALDVVKGRIFEPPVFFSPSFQSVCKANANRLLATASRSARRNVKVLLIFSSYSWQEKASEPIFFFFFYQTISSKQEDFITMSTQQWLACCPCKHTVEHTPAAGERWRRTELWGRGQGKPSKSDLLYLHPGSLSLNISVRVCTRNRGGGGGRDEGAEDM